MSPVAAFEFALLLLVAVLGLELLAKVLRLPPAAALIAGGIVLAFVLAAAADGWGLFHRLGRFP